MRVFLNCEMCAKNQSCSPGLVQKDFYTVEEVARYVRRSAFTVRRWITEGKIAGIRLAGTGPRGRLLVSHDEFLRLFDKE
jgi:excisionase family DNA binding protein